VPDHSIEKLLDRAKVSTTTTGTGTMDLGSAADGYQDFSGLTSGKSVYYTITSASDSWEVGVGVYTSGSPSTLTRATILSSSNSGSAITLSGTSDVWIDLPAAEAVYGIGSGGKMRNTSTQSISTGALSQLEFDATSAPGFAAVGDAVVLDTSNDKLVLKKKGLYQVTIMLGLVDSDAMGSAGFWLTLGTGTSLATQFSMVYSSNANSDSTYGIVSTPYYCSSPDDDIYACVWPDAVWGSSSYDTIPGTDRYEPKFSAVYIR